MRSIANNAMSLEQWSNLAMIDPFALGGWCVADGDSGCQCQRQTYFEYQYQGHVLSRQEISLAIEEAERLISLELGTYVAPTGIVNEVRKYPQPDRNKRSLTTHTRSARSHMITTDGKRYKSVVADYGYIQSLGTYVDTLVGETTNLTRDPKTGLFTATITLAEAPTGGEEYLAYFVEEDRLGDDYQDWQVRDIRTSVDGTTLTIIGGAYTLMKPECRLGRKWECQSEANSKNYVTSLLIYERVIDENNHGTLQWGVNPCTDPNGCNDVVIRQTCLQRDDFELQPTLRPQPMSYNSDTDTWSTYDVNVAPDYAVINYIAGIPRDNRGWVSQPLAKAVFYLSASLLESEAAECGCDSDGARERLNKLKDVQKARVKQIADDINQTPFFEERILTRPGHLDYTWGGLLGAVKAWHIVTDFREKTKL